MRQVLCLSLTEQTAKELKKNSKSKGFDSVSAYVKFLLDQDKDLISEKDLMKAVRSARSEYRRGKTVKAGSLADLV